jgi:hypothetical protein
MAPAPGMSSAPSGLQEYSPEHLVAHKPLEKATIAGSAPRIQRLQGNPDTRDQARREEMNSRRPRSSAFLTARVSRFMEFDATKVTFSSRDGPSL